MEANLTGFLIFTGCGALLCILWFFLALRKKTGSGKAALFRGGQVIRTVSEDRAVDALIDEIKRI